jgi:hypothetical protein
MNLAISVIGNCQANSWAIVLQALQPKINITHCEFAGSDFEITKKTSSVIRNSDLLLLVDPEMPALKTEKFLDFQAGVRSISVPSLICSVFHPDNGYVFSGDTLIRNGLNGDWNSKIQAEAFKTGSSYQDFLDMYNDVSLYQELGYFNLWEDFIQHTKNNFNFFDLDFERWLSQVRRTDVFMHGINHPRLQTISFLAEQVLDSLGFSYFPSVSVSTSINDPLNSNVWPINKNVAEYFSVPESNFIVVNGKRVEEEYFLKLTWDFWSKKSASKGNMNSWPPLNPGPIREWTDKNE